MAVHDHEILHEMQFKTGPSSSRVIYLAKLLAPFYRVVLRDFPARNFDPSSDLNILSNVYFSLKPILTWYDFI